MDDWDQPNTSFQRSPGGVSNDGNIEALQQQLTEALDRIAALEQRVTQLEGRTQSA